MLEYQHLLSPISTLFSKLIVVLRVVNSSEELLTWSRSGPLAKHVFPKKVYQLRETVLDKFYSFNIPHSDDQKVWENIALVNFESVCVQADTFCVTHNTISICKHVPISFSFSSILFEEQFFV